jgi:hypothetical protein
MRIAAYGNGRIPMDNDNMNSDGPMFCWGCEWFDISMGAQGYSELTPGYPGHMECNKGHFSFTEGAHISRKILRESVAKAATCPDYRHAESND